MEVYGLYIPDKPLSNFELIKYAKELNIANFRGVYMRDELPEKPRKKECGIVNGKVGKCTIVLPSNFSPDFV